MTHLPPAKPLLATACAAILGAGVLTLLLDANLIEGTSAAIVPFLVNCAAAASLVARCILH